MNEDAIRRRLVKRGIWVSFWELVVECFFRMPLAFEYGKDGAHLCAQCLDL